MLSPIENWHERTERFSEGLQSVPRSVPPTHHTECPEKYTISSSPLTTQLQYIWKIDHLAPSVYYISDEQRPWGPECLEASLM